MFTPKAYIHCYNEQLELLWCDFYEVGDILPLTSFYHNLKFVFIGNSDLSVCPDCNAVSSDMDN